MNMHRLKSCGFGGSENQTGRRKKCSFCVLNQWYIRVELKCTRNAHSGSITCPVKLKLRVDVLSLQCSLCWANPCSFHRGGDTSVAKMTCSAANATSGWTERRTRTTTTSGFFAAMRATWTGANGVCRRMWTLTRVLENGNDLRTEVISLPTWKSDKGHRILPDHIAQFCKNVSRSFFSSFFRNRVERVLLFCLSCALLCCCSLWFFLQLGI